MSEFTYQTEYALSAEEELRLLKLKTQEAKDELVEANLPNALAYVRIACLNLLPPDEQLSIAGTTLMRCVESFDFNLSQRLIVYARPFLKGAVRTAWRQREPVNYGDTIPEKCHLDFDAIDRALEGESPAPYDEIHIRELVRLIRPLINRLNEKQKEVVLFHYESGFSFSAISRFRRYGTRQAVQRIHRNALRKLRKWLMQARIYKALKEDH